MITVRTASPLKVQIVFTEFEGDKKVKSLPYTMVFTAGSHRDAEVAKLRVGSRIPVLAEKMASFSMSISGQISTAAPSNSKTDDMA